MYVGLFTLKYAYFIIINIFTMTFNKCTVTINIFNLSLNDKYNNNYFYICRIFVYLFCRLNNFFFLHMKNTYVTITITNTKVFVLNVLTIYSKRF